MISTETDNAVITALYFKLTALSTFILSYPMRYQEYLYFFNDSAVNTAYNRGRIPEVDTTTGS